MSNEKKKYESPVIVDMGDAKEIIKNVFISGSGDTFPGTEDTLESG
jgi:hypothetical protein|tara:strand:- start:138 stop:275 length:138 start_codon:yes stop_codon:yes gene_type:complete